MARQSINASEIRPCEYPFVRDFNPNYSAKRVRERAAQPIERRLKSLDEFERPWWYPTFRLPTVERPGPFPWVYLILGGVLGAALGWYVFP